MNKCTLLSQSQNPGKLGLVLRRVYYVEGLGSKFQQLLAILIHKNE